MLTPHSALPASSATAADKPPISCSDGSTLVAATKESISFGWWRTTLAAESGTMGFETSCPSQPTKASNSRLTVSPLDVRVKEPSRNCVFMLYPFEDDGILRAHADPPPIGLSYTGIEATYGRFVDRVKNRVTHRRPAHRCRPIHRRNVCPHIALLFSIDPRYPHHASPSIRGLNMDKHSKSCTTRRDMLTASCLMLAAIPLAH